MVSQAERRAATVAAVLSAARKAFAANGFEATTIDAIAARAGVAKGAVYHHFASKEEIFEHVLDGIVADIAREVPLAAASAGGDLVDQMERGTLKYFESATAPGVRRILLIDGPAVLGWNKWREIDRRHFGRLVQIPLQHALGARLSAGEIDALFDLLTGAVTEAAFICAAAKKPRKKARELAAGLRRLIAGVVSASQS